jgi:hypothetical protein
VAARWRSPWQDQRVIRDVWQFLRANPQVLVLLLVCLILGLGTFLAVVFGLITSKSTTTTGQPVGWLLLSTWI